MARNRSESVSARFARNLAQCRRASGLSQGELGARSGLSRSHISIMEHGKRAPRIDTLVKLCGGLGVEPQELLDGITWKPTEP